MQNIKEGRSSIPAIEKDTVSPPLAAMLTTKAMRFLFIAKMFQLSFAPLGFWKPDDDVIKIIAFSVVVSIWGFAVWMESAYRNKMNLQPPRCRKIRCSRCNTRKKYPRWFKYKHWVYFLLLFVTLTFFNFVVQLVYAKKEEIASEIDMKSDDMNSFLLLSSMVIVALIHLMTACTFKNYYLHNDPFEIDNGTYADEKQPASEKAII